jgi:anti-anti-sigma regulatory factor
MTKANAERIRAIDEFLQKQTQPSVPADQAISTSDDHETFVVKLQVPDLVGANVAVVRAAMQKQFSNWTGNTAILDLERVQAIDSSGLLFLIDLPKQFGHPMRFVFRNISPSLVKVLGEAGARKLVEF